MARSAEPEAVLAGSIPAVVRFGVFELDVRARELRKAGLKVRLPDQPFHVLALLLEQPGEVVTREALRLRLWPGDTFVEFNLSLNSAVRKLREALGDSAENPTFIETLPRRGYRFIAPVERPPPSNSIPTVPDTGPGRVLSPPRLWWSAAGLLAIVAAVAVMPRTGGESTNKPTPPSSPSPQTRAVSPEADGLYPQGSGGAGKNQPSAESRGHLVFRAGDRQAAGFRDGARTSCGGLDAVPLRRTVAAGRSPAQGGEGGAQSPGTRRYAE